MKVNAGLYPNANPSLVNSDTKSYALNVLYNEDGETLINENGFEKHHDYSDYGQCIGTIPIPVGVVLFSLIEMVLILVYLTEIILYGIVMKLLKVI